MKILEKIGMALSLIILVPLFIILSPLGILYYYVFTFFEKRKYPEYNCSAPYTPFITKSEMFKVFRILSKKNITHEIYEDDDFEYIYCPEYSVCFVIISSASGVWVEEGRITVEFHIDDGSHDPTKICDLTDIIRNTEQQKNCKCFACYSSKQTENIEIEEELLQSSFIDTENSELKEKICKILSI